jgi:protease I
MATVARCRFDLAVCGGTYVDKPCVIDGNMVSGRTWHDHYMKHWFNLLIEEWEKKV